jgi:hypothetical protein
MKKICEDSRDFGVNVVTPGKYFKKTHHKTLGENDFADVQNVSNLL